jgi:hypothetical protein
MAVVLSNGPEGPLFIRRTTGGEELSEHANQLLAAAITAPSEGRRSRANSARRLDAQAEIVRKMPISWIFPFAPSLDLYAQPIGTLEQVLSIPAPWLTEAEEQERTELKAQLYSLRKRLNVLEDRPQAAWLEMSMEERQQYRKAQRDKALAKGLLVEITIPDGLCAGTSERSFSSL